MDIPHRDPGFVDPKSNVGKFPRPAQFADVLVVGAGKAGIAAALKAARAGQSVLLVDEHPVAPGMAGLDVPYLFGGRATGAIANQARMIEQVAANIDGLDEVYDAGVEVLLGVSVWGAWVNGPNLQALPCPIAGLATEERSWLCGFGSIVVASGARDLVLSFKGSDQPGVVGAQALHALLTRYDAFAGRNIVLLGSGRLALETALLALDRGLAVPALIEVRDRPQGPEDLLAALRARSVEILCGHVPLMAETTTDGV
ncbi:MAG TPA: FAD-dependent oxidoreductase, partial [Acidiphilium sp.]